MSENPYASPPIVENVPLAVPVSSTAPATQGLRFVNYLIDNLITYFISSAVGFVIGFVYALSLPDPSKGISPAQLPALQVTAWFAGVFAVMGYYIVCESLMQRTIGKLATGTKVVTQTGGVPTFGQIVGRSFARLIPFEPFSCLSANPVGWHDSLSKTRVVKA